MPVNLAGALSQAGVKTLTSGSSFSGSSFHFPTSSVKKIIQSPTTQKVLNSGVSAGSLAGSLYGASELYGMISMKTNASSELNISSQDDISKAKANARLTNPENIIVLGDKPSSKEFSNTGELAKEYFSNSTNALEGVNQATQKVNEESMKSVPESGGVFKELANLMATNSVGLNSVLSQGFNLLFTQLNQISAEIFGLSATQNVALSHSFEDREDGGRFDLEKERVRTTAINENAKIALEEKRLEFEKEKFTETVSNTSTIAQKLQTLTELSHLANLSQISVHQKTMADVAQSENEDIETRRDLKVKELETQSYLNEKQDIKDLDGEVVATMTPLQATATKSIADARYNTDRNNDEIDEDEFDMLDKALDPLKDIFSMSNHKEMMSEVMQECYN